MTPQKSDPMTRMKGFWLAAMKIDGEIAAMPCPRVTAKNSVTKIMKNAYPALEGLELKPCFNTQ